MLLQWFKANGRHDLPWRKSSDPYRIYLSEVMLQQTQVDRVIEYYHRFLERFPSLYHLSLAKEEEVLALWSGLGYYTRARNLLQSAKICKSQLPTSYKELLKLPGIGTYTAAAICSFAYNQPIAVVDTNIKRVLSRYFATSTKINSLAEQFLDQNHPKEHNLALMDVGALVCLPKDPDCSLCPLRTACKGKEQPQEYWSTPKKQYETLELFLGICIKDGMVALVPSTQKLYQGLLVLPTIDPVEENYITTIRHSYTKYRIKAHIYFSPPPKEAKWIKLSDLDTAPIPTLVKKLFLLEIS